MSAPASPPGKAEVAAGAGLVSVGQLVSGVLGLLLLACLTRFVDKSTFALLAIVHLVEETIQAIGILGLPTALAYFVPMRGEAAARSLGFWTGAFLFGVSIPVAAALSFAGPWVGDTPGLSIALRFLAVYLLLDFPAQALPGWLLARRAYRGQFAATVFFAASRFASLVVPAALGASLETLFFWYVAFAGVRLATFLVTFLVVAKGSLSPKHFRAKEMLAYGVPLSLSLVVGKINVQIDKYLVLVLCAAEVFAVYRVGAIEIPLVQTLAYAVTNALVPALVLAFDRKDVAGFVDLWHGAVVKVAAVMMPVFFFLFVLAEPLVRLLFTARYGDAAVPLRVYLLLLPLRLCSYGGIVRATGDTRPVITSSIAALAVNAASIYPFYLLFGLAGPALAAVAGQVVAVVVLLTHLRLRLKLPVGGVFPWRALARTMGVAGAAALPLVGLAIFVRGDVLRVALGGAAYLAAYVLLGLRVGVVTTADFRYLGDLFTLRGLRKGTAAL